MRDKAALPEPVAVAEVGRYCWWPTQASSYLTGCLEILEIRRRYLERAGSRAAPRRRPGRGAARLPRHDRGVRALPLGLAERAVMASSPEPRPWSRSVPLILDVDTGIDDASRCCTPARARRPSWSRSPACPGNAALADMARNTRGVLELAGRRTSRSRRAARHRCCGRSRSRPRRTARTASGTRSCPSRDAPSPRSGPELIVEEARRRPGELTLVTLGPLTNLALALLVEPELPRLLRRWVSMGGAFRAPGNTTPVSEWNVHCDPEAAKSRSRAWQAAVDRDPSTPGRWRWASTSRSGRGSTDHVVALARRAGAGPTTRSIPAASPVTPEAAERGQQPGGPVRRRRAALVLRVPRPVRRVLRGVHPRPARRRGRARPVARTTRPSRWTWTPRAGRATARRSPTGAGCGSPPNVDVA